MLRQVPESVVTGNRNFARTQKIAKVTQLTTRYPKSCQESFEKHYIPITRMRLFEIMCYFNWLLGLVV
jgi:hypothetical protein